MEVLNDASKFQIVALITLIVAFVSDLVGFAAPYWLHYKTENTLYSFSYYQGLCQECIAAEVKLLGTSETKCNSITSSSNPGWFKAVQAFACLGFLCLLAAVVCSGLKMFLMKDRREVLIACICATFAGVVCIFLSVVIYGAKQNEVIKVSSLTFHFAFAFCIIGMIAVIIAGVLTVLDLIQIAMLTMPKSDQKYIGFMMPGFNLFCRFESYAYD